MFEDMAEKTLRVFSAPTTANIRIGPAVNTGENEFELKPPLITMVQASQFCGKAHEDASAHLQHFLEIYLLTLLNATTGYRRRRQKCPGRVTLFTIG